MRILIIAALGLVLLTDETAFGNPMTPTGLFVWFGLLGMTTMAAGRANRMGQAKQLLDCRGKLILQCVIDNALQSDLDKVIVILGSYRSEILKRIAFKEAETLYNPEYESGQSSSVLCGINHCKADESALFLLGDQPFVAQDIINLIIKKHKSQKPLAIIPTCERIMGNPVLINSSLYAELKNLEGDIGPRKILRNKSGVCLLDVKNQSILQDIDTPEDWQNS
ncbi:nucleotidyltransferase family protein [Maridesulfovibrio ferrireducens]|uniref:nucleotidyltransferase family protein n=1 Tax=Maridesulfovibrio ferrireducens TaxID=246191 RepID=UPI001A241A63|nr:nucleotidyltransferase family protein [Maridesulfovibrio ferrireducens]MBI9110232.1 nucleotidyltransferase family protein [Maridesulfovibrio ferrireducens]